MALHQTSDITNLLIFKIFLLCLKKRPKSSRRAKSPLFHRWSRRCLPRLHDGSHVLSKRSFTRQSKQVPKCTRLRPVIRSLVNWLQVRNIYKIFFDFFKSWRLKKHLIKIRFLFETSLIWSRLLFAHSIYPIYNVLEFFKPLQEGISKNRTFEIPLFRCDYTQKGIPRDRKKSRTWKSHFMVNSSSLRQFSSY